MSKAKPFTMLLVRTGSTVWDRENRIGGGADLPLAEGSDSIPIEVSQIPSIVISASDECSLESAKAAAKATGAKTRAIDGLGDIGMGLWEGVTHQELEERCPSAFKQWKERPDSISAPEGESLAAAEDRLIGEINRVATKLKGENPILMVVLRPMAFALVRAKLLGRSPAELWEILQDAPHGVESFKVASGALVPRLKRISA